MVKPNFVALPVRSSTSQVCASICMPVPTVERIWPMK